MRHILSCCLVLCWLCPVFVGAQVNYSANDTIVPYTGFFRPGTNLGEYASFSDELLAEISAGNPNIDLEGVGIKAVRPGLFEDFVELFGYESRLNAFALYDSLDMRDNTMIVGFPSPQHQDPTYHCPTIQSTLFANLYTDIWDDGANGTPVNDDNYYALYLYRLATLYKDYIKFWEIWNEPGFDYTEATGFLPPGAPGNWWENNPNPCDYKLRAPIFHYVRMLRISYEVIKSIDPEAYIAVSGVGYPSFLDAILRNTDNPFDGSSNDDYPLRGGAYFDVMGYHAYPHFDGSLRYWDNNIMDFAYQRHSDAAADGLITQHLDTLGGVLANYGYDGITYPQKPWIITECNLPRKPFEDFIGSAEAQRNFVIKAQVTCLKNDILQFHIFKLAEDQAFDDAYYEFDLMGLYKKLDFADGYFQTPNDEGIAYRTATDLMYGHRYDAERTAAMNLPTGVRGAALKDDNDNYTYVLWAETSIDNSEAASANYSFPTSFGLDEVLSYAWDYGATRDITTLSPENIVLSGAPLFFRAPSFRWTPAVSCAPENIVFSPTVIATSWSWQFPGGQPVASTEQTPTISYTEAGEYPVTLQAFDGTGSLIVEQTQTIRVQELPQASFDAYSSGPLLILDNTSSLNSDQFLWEFGDGQTSTEASPQHLYLTDGTYTVTLTVSNPCGNSQAMQSFTVDVPNTTQLDYTANDEVAPYDSPFRLGVNLAYFPPWTDEQLAEIAAGQPNLGINGAGVKSLRTLLPQYFLEFWGYEVRVDAFEYYHNLDLQENVVTVGFPSVSVQDPRYHCPDYQSTLFDNLYLDIWDDGSDGTPINEDNYYATYLYHTVKTYKDQVRFWEILNGPDFDASGEKGWLPPGEAGNWWEQNPDPCDYALHAPIFYYIRMLRISYEVIKSLDEDSYVTLSGIAYPSFLDALLRNTDNPMDGSVVAGYEKRGGAYFDAVGFSAFPHFDGSTIYYDLDIGGFAYERHSDAAVKSIPNAKSQFESVLLNYGYDGTNFPEKQWIVSACNLPRKAFGDYMGSAEAQRNFVIKAYIESVLEDIRQFHLRQIAETATYETATDAFQLMGLYQQLEGVAPYNQVINDEGIAYKTVSDLLFGSHYDASRTAEMNLPDEIRGAAFVDGNGAYTYVLWAKTMTDQSEDAAATYSLPASFGSPNLYRKAWDYSATGLNPQISTIDIALSGSPIFLTDAESPLLPPLAQFEAAQTEACPGATIQFTDASLRAESWAWSFPGGQPTTSNEQHPTVFYPHPGNYEVILVASNPNGSHSAIYHDYIFIDSVPQADFIYTIDGPWVDFDNTSVNADNYIWSFGDGTFDYGFHPNHYYFNNGNFTVEMIAMNECGNDTTEQIIALANVPQANFSFDQVGDCGPYQVFFTDLSPSTPTSWVWSFPGAEPATSSEKNPTVTYTLPGSYVVTLVVSNEFGSDTISQSLTLGDGLYSSFTPLLCPDDQVVVNGTLYDLDENSGVEIFAGQGANGCDSIVYVQLQFYQNLQADLSATICEGENYTLGDSTFNTSGNFSVFFTSVGGCDSIIHLALDVIQSELSTDEVQVCSGDELLGQIWTMDGSLVDTLSSSLGCDSLIQTTYVTVEPTYLVQLADTIISGEQVVIGNSIYDTTGFYVDTLVATNGCDSIIELDLTLDLIDAVNSPASERFALHYQPNPFSSGLDIYFNLPNPTSYRLAIFNINGQRIREFAYERNAVAGAQYVRLEAEDIPAGVYWCRLQIGQEEIVFRVVKIGR